MILRYHHSTLTRFIEFDYKYKCIFLCFDTRCHTRHVLLKLYYLGWDYHGFTTQENSGQTIEHHLFAALQKTCLIECRETSNYHRCGRTDKGVSAFSQVIHIL